MKFSFRLIFIFVFLLSISGNVYYFTTSKSHLYLPSLSHGNSETNHYVTEHEIHQPRVLSGPPPSVNATAMTVGIGGSTMTTLQNRNYEKSLSELEFFDKIFGRSLEPLVDEQFTILMMTYKRPSLLKVLIPHYCSTGEKVHKILIVWNDVESEVPNYLKEIVCEVNLEFIVSKENKLTNRFIPYPQIETEGVFCIDDDRKITHKDLILAFQLWQQLRHRILGFERRSHTVLPDGSYEYGDKEETLMNYGYSMVLSTNFILHKAYFEMFQLDEFLPKGIVEYVDEKMNCEDFAMCMMVADFIQRVTYLQSCCAVIKGSLYPSNMEEKNDPDGYQGLSKRGGRHYSERTKCLNDFRAFYKDGKLPLYYTHMKLMHENKAYYSRRRKRD